MAAELSFLLYFLATYLQTDHVCIYIIPQLVILSSHFQVGWGASTRETVKKYSIKILALCTMERKDARDGIMSEKCEYIFKCNIRYVILSFEQ